jgi:eukaryotic-like serine/threonine-protein kinase
MGRADLTDQVLDDRYRVIEPIGEGAMGNVYRGERIGLGRPVAVKVLNDNFQNDSSRKRFQREAMAMAKLEHPNCGAVLDVGSHANRPYVVMEFVSGQNLKELLKAGAVPVTRAVEITRQVLSGLSHAHEHGIIHRDIKPANVVLSQKSGVGDLVKILDFGCARFDRDTSNLTGGMVLGTPNYMAPEQIRGGEIDHRVDLYAAGVMLFELLTGVKPFHADDPMAVCMQHITFAPPRLADKAPSRSFGPLEDVVARALEKDPADRFASAEEFSRTLVAAASAIDGGRPSRASSPAAVELESPSGIAPTLARPASRTRAASSRKLLAIVGGLTVIAIAIGVVLATRSDTEPQSAPTDVEAARTVEAPVPPPKPAPTGDPITDLIAEAHALADAGRREPALDLLLKARKTYPKEARIPYEASKLYLEKMWWADGLKLARVALALDPAYKSDADLIKLVLKGFNTTASYDWTLAKFLREDIGASAKPFVEDTAQSHPNPIVRKRAAAELKRYR